MDLKLVRLLRDAIRTADLAGGKVGPFGACVGPRILPRRRIEPEPLIEPRVRIEPEPRFEPRPVVHPAPRVENAPAGPDCQTPRPCQKAGPLQPPWRMPVWNMPLQPAPKVKIHIHRTDLTNKGSLIDLFL